MENCKRLAFLVEWWRIGSSHETVDRDRANDVPNFPAKFDFALSGQLGRIESFVFCLEADYCS